MVLTATHAADAQVGGDSWNKPFFVEETPVLLTGNNAMRKAADNGAATRAASDGVYYLRPEGAFYQGIRPKDWSFYPVTKIVVQPWLPVTYQNAAGGTATWIVEGEAVEADGEGNYTETVEPIPNGYLDHYLPTMECNGVSYTLGEGHQSWESVRGSIAWADSITELSNFDPGRVIGRNGTTVYTNFRPLSMTSSYKYNYGTMDIYTGGSTYYCRGVRQFFERPMAPLYVENVTIPAISYGAQMFKGDATLTLTFYSASGDELGEPLCTMVCGGKDIVNQGSQNVGGTTLKTGTLVFSRTDGEEPLLLTDAFAVVIEGFQEEGVDVGLAAALIDPCDQTLCKGANMLLQDESHQDIDATLTFNTRVPCISIRGMYDGLKMVSTGDNLTLTAPEEGGACMAQGGKAATVSLKTAIAWKATSANPNYELEGMPDWLTVKVDESQRYFAGANNYGHGLVKLTFTAEALPEGEDYRTAELYVKGKGVSTETPIVITQERLDKSAETALLDELQSQIEAAEDQLLALEQQKEEMTDQYTANKEKAAQLLTDIAALEEKVKTDGCLTDEEKAQLADEIRQLKESVSELDSENEAINSAMGTLADAVRTAGNSLEKLHSNAAQLSTQLEAAKDAAALAAVAEKLTEAQQKVAEDTEALSNAQGEYGSQQQRLTDIGQELDQKQTDLGELQDEVAKIELGIGQAAVSTGKAVDVYSATGVRVRSNATTTADLPAGIYLIGNRKVVVR